MVKLLYISGAILLIIGLFTKVYKVEQFPTGPGIIPKLDTPYGILSIPLLVIGAAFILVAYIKSIKPYPWFLSV